MVKINNDLIIMWFESSELLYQNSNVSITFPISFYTSNYKCFTNYTSTSGDYGKFSTVTAIIQGPRTQSNVNIYIGSNGGGAEIGYTFNLLAIGI